VLVWCWSGGGLTWIAYNIDITRVVLLTLWLRVRVSAPCIDGAGPASP
jgi:hypothetical protein